MTRRELVWITDLAGDQVDALGHGFLDLWTDTRLDQSETMGFEVAADHPKVGRLVPDVELKHRSRRFYVVEVEQLRRGAQTTVAVEAFALWYRLGDQLWAGSFLATQLTPRQGLDAILEGSGWTVGGQTSLSTTPFSMEEQDKSRLGLLRAWAKVTGRSLVFDTFTENVDLVDTRGVARGLAFRYGRNVMGMRRRLRAPETTRLYAYGADDLSIAGLNGDPYVEDFTYYTDRGLTLEEAEARFAREKMFSDSSFVADTDLLAAAEDRLDELAVEQVSYEIDVVDLSEFTEVAETANVGDTVGVYDPDFDQDVRPIVTRYQRHWLQPWRNKIELATIPPVVSDGSRSSRPSSAEQWLQFLGPITADFTIRNDGTYTVARIPLRFREGGRANYHLDLTGTGVGAGTMHVEIYDDETDTTIRSLDAAYTDGDPVRVWYTWAVEELVGFHNLRLRVSTTADGGPSPTNGVDLALEDEGRASFYVMCQGAVLERPSEANSVTFDYTGAVQTWTVPDNVEGPITITARGAAGESGSSAGSGAGGQIIASFPSVTPGESFDIYVGGTGSFPNGGAAGQTQGAGIRGRYGGGSSHVVPDGGALADALLVAAGGGGASVDNGGGAGGFFVGVDGVTGSAAGGGGATQFAGGAGGTSSNPDWYGVAGTAGQGGRGGNAGGLLGNSGGGGGGGVFGGGGGGALGSVNGAGPGGGGGGTGAVRSDGYDLEFSDGIVTGNGQVVISWETPA